MHEILVGAVSGLTASILPTVGILMVWLQNKEKFSAINQRLDDMREIWRSELKRVEEVIDARLKHLEEKA